MDLGLLPVIFREPSHRKRFKMYGSDNELSSEQELSGEYTDQGSIGVHEPYVMATLCLSSRAYVIGQHVIADVTIENHLQGTILCTVKLEQVSLVRLLSKLMFLVARFSCGMLCR